MTTNSMAYDIATRNSATKDDEDGEIQGDIEQNAIQVSTAGKQGNIGNQPHPENLLPLLAKVKTCHLNHHPCCSCCRHQPDIGPEFQLPPQRGCLQVPSCPLSAFSLLSAGSLLTVFSASDGWRIAASLGSCPDPAAAYITPCTPAEQDTVLFGVGQHTPGSICSRIAFSSV